MPYDIEILRRIYNRTDGHCHICGKKLSFANYAIPGSRGAWEVEHSVAKAMGGTGHLNNLFPACIACNRAKGTNTSRSARIQKGRRKIPLSRDRKENIRDTNALVGIVLGVIVGGIFSGPPGALVGGAIGGILGHSSDPEAE
jgi:hypothetical protein